MVVPKKSKKTQKKKTTLRFTIDCQLPSEDGLMKVDQLEQFFRGAIKVDKKLNNFGDLVNIEKTNTTVTVVSERPFSKRYLKYLTKKFLMKCKLRDWIRVVASDQTTYELRYFQMSANEEEEDEAED